MGLFGLGKKKKEPPKAPSDWREDEVERQEAEGSLLLAEAQAADRAGEYEQALRLYRCASKFGNMPAMFRCAEMYETGRGAEKDPAQAYDWYEKAALTGYAPAQMACGDRRYTGDGADRDPADALFWYGLAAEKGVAQAQLNYAVMCALGDGVPEDRAKGLQKIESALIRNGENAKDALKALAARDRAAGKGPAGLIDDDALDGLISEAERSLKTKRGQWYNDAMALYRARKYAGAFPLLAQLCDSADGYWGEHPADAWAAKGWLYENRKDAAPDPDAAYRCYRAAARYGDRDGKAGMVRLAARREDISAADLQAALGYARELNDAKIGALLPALEEKLAKAQDQERYEAGAARRLEEAKGLFADAAAAGRAGDHARQLALYQRAAELGMAEAQYNCGVLYEKGEGTEIDRAKALAWYEKAARQGDRDAQFACAAMYDGGPDTAEDPAKALYWYEHAARQGSVSAMFNCGNMYSKGRGTEADRGMALRWYEQAGIRAHAKAQTNCALLLYRGEGVRQDLPKAKLWFQKAYALADGVQMQDKLRKAVSEVDSDMWRHKTPDMTAEEAEAYMDEIRNDII